MATGREQLDMAKEMTQRSIDRIVSAINPVKGVELPFVAFALHEVLENMRKKMDKTQEAVYEGMFMFFGSECHTQRYDQNAVAEEDRESNDFTSDRIREKNKKKG